MTDPADRVRSLEQMLERRPDDSRVRFALAVEFQNQGRYEDAAEALRTYLEASDDEGNAWGRLATVLLELGRDDEAREAYRRGIAAAERHGHPTMAEEFTEELGRVTS